MTLGFDIPGWFFEQTPFGREHTLGLAVSDKVYSTQSEFQQIEVYDTVSFGRMLVLDGVIQLTEFDETSYHEMFVHVPMCCHPDPRRVLVIGGGDGGIVRELVRWPCLDEIVLCEIDIEVVHTAQKYLPFTSAALADPRVQIVTEDGAAYVSQRPESFDLILTDSSDPVGPAEVLFRRPFYEGLHQALRPEGLAVSQCETIFFYPEVISELVTAIRDLFPRLQYLNTAVPTYPSGMIGLLVCSKAEQQDSSHPIRDLPAGVQHQLRYYTPRIHTAAFQLPAFAERLFE